MGPFSAGTSATPSVAGGNILSRAGDTLQGAFDTFLNGVSNAAARTLDAAGEAGAKSVQEILPIWAGTQLRMQLTDQLDDPTIGDVDKLLAQRIDQNLRTTLDAEPAADFNFGSANLGILELAVVTGIAVIGVLLAVRA